MADKDALTTLLDAVKKASAPPVPKKPKETRDPSGLDVILKAVREQRERHSEAMRELYRPAPGETVTQKLKRVPGTLENAMAVVDRLLPKLDAAQRGEVLSYLWAKWKPEDAGLPASGRRTDMRKLAEEAVSLVKAGRTGEMRAFVENYRKQRAAFQQKARKDAEAGKQAEAAPQVRAPRYPSGNLPNWPLDKLSDWAAEALTNAAGAVLGAQKEARTAMEQAVARALSSVGAKGAAKPVSETIVPMVLPLLGSKASAPLAEMLSKGMAEGFADVLRAPGDVVRALDPSQAPGDRAGAAFNVATSGLLGPSFKAAKSAFKTLSGAAAKAGVSAYAPEQEVLDVLTVVKETAAAASRPKSAKTSAAKPSKAASEASQAVQEAAQAAAAKPRARKKPEADLPVDPPALVKAAEGPPAKAVHESRRRIRAHAPPEPDAPAPVGAPQTPESPSVAPKKPRKTREERLKQIDAEIDKSLKNISDLWNQPPDQLVFSAIGPVLTPGQLRVLTEEIPRLAGLYVQKGVLKASEVADTIVDLLKQSGTVLSAHAERAVRSVVYSMFDDGPYAMTHAKSRALTGLVARAGGPVSMQEVRALAEAVLNGTLRVEQLRPDLPDAVKVDVLQTVYNHGHRVKNSLVAVAKEALDAGDMATVNRLAFQIAELDDKMFKAVEELNVTASRLGRGLAQFSRRPLEGSHTALFSRLVKAVSDSGMSSTEKGRQAIDAAKEALDRLKAAEDVYKAALRSEQAVVAGLRTVERTAAHVVLTARQLTSRKWIESAYKEMLARRGTKSKPRGKQGGGFLNVPQEIADSVVSFAYHYWKGKTDFEDIRRLMKGDLGREVSERDAALAAKAFFDLLTEQAKAAAKRRQDKALSTARSALRAKVYNIMDEGEAALQHAVRYALASTDGGFEDMAETVFAVLGKEVGEKEVADAYLKVVRRKALTKEQKEALSRAAKRSKAIRATAEAVSRGADGPEDLVESVKLRILAGETDLESLIANIQHTFTWADREAALEAVAQALASHKNALRAMQWSARESGLQMTTALRKAVAKLTMAEHLAARQKAFEAGAARRFAFQAGTSARVFFSMLRNIAASGELSFVFRQGLIVAVNNPKNLKPALAACFKAVRDRGYDNVLLDLSMQRWHDTAVQSGLAIVSTKSVKGLNEAFVEGTELLPRFFAPLVWWTDANNRIYEAFVSALRMRAFSDIADAIVMAEGGLTPEKAKAVANFVNRTTGRGVLGPGLAKHDSAVSLLNYYFFSARWLLATLQNSTGLTLAHTLTEGGGPVLTKAALSRYARLGAAQAAVFGLFHLAAQNRFYVGDADLGTEFPRLTVADKEIDPTAGYLPTAAMVYKTLFEAARSAMGDVPSKPWPGRKTRADSFIAVDKRGEWDRFVRSVASRTAPHVRALTDLSRARTFSGEPATGASVLFGLALPITYRNALEDFTDAKGNEAAERVAVLLEAIGVGTRDAKEDDRPYSPFRK